jgi:sugar phosphate isomerase/epimerase
MPEVPIWDALPRLKEMGYEAVEICVAERWPTAPHKLGAADRERLRLLLEELGLELSGFLVFINPVAAAGEELERQAQAFRAACRLARSLSTGPPPPIASPLGSCPLTWEEAFPLVLERVGWFAGIAASERCRYALEPHVHGLLDRPGRVVEIMDRLRSPSLGINFDISHFAVAGYPRTETIRTLAPYALHTHVKDGRMVDGQVQFLLPGEGAFDYPAYFREMAQAGYAGCVTAEVSAQIFNRADYDPWPAARVCLAALRRAREAAL